MYHCSLECPKDLFLALFSFWCTIYDLEELSKQLNSRLSVKDTGMCNFQVNTKENYIQSVRSWMTVNKLKLNDAKTEVMVVASSHNQCCLRDISIKIGEAIVAPKPNVKKNLGAFLDATLSMEKQVGFVARNTISPKKLVQMSSMQQSYPILTITMPSCSA